MTYIYQIYLLVEFIKSFFCDMEKRLLDSGLFRETEKATLSVELYSRMPSFVSDL